jgi:hypothetical protein
MTTVLRAAATHMHAMQRACNHYTLNVCCASTNGQSLAHCGKLYLFSKGLPGTV